MTVTTTPTAALGVEWTRLAHLSTLLSQARHGQSPSPDQLETLEEMQKAVIEVRQPQGPWALATGQELSHTAFDLLACAVAPEAEPRLGFMFQSLQPGVTHPYPSAALVHELLAMEGEDTNRLFAEIEDDAPLRREGLITLDGDNPFDAIRPAPGLTNRLLSRSGPAIAPPGSTRVQLAPTWDDLVLPADRIAMLREFLGWVRHRGTVFGDWGGSDSGGPVALFSGPSGTGKTYAAAALANELEWPLYRVDLGSLVSKYIGETEKNLNRLFDAAHDRPIVIQFDEADSLFSKRGEVKEARDRYANMEVSHLLARIETHRGPCILTTNLRRNLDTAFARRFQVVVDFPRPDARARQRLWELLLPPRAPRSADLYTEFLAEAINLTGGEIRNAALHAAVLAAAGSGVIGLEEATLAVWREISKDGREHSSSDLGALSSHFPEGGMLC